jgi:hypothetical protein
MRVLLLSPILFLLIAAAAQSPGPVQLTAAQDHQRLLDLLHITALRPGVTQSGNGLNPVNYDESKANPWPTLPNPLVLANGKPVLTAKDWTTKRRPELVELFDREIFGRIPANAPAVHWQVVSTESGTDDGIATITKHLIGHVDNSAYPAIAVNMEATLTLPLNAPRPMPVVLEYTGVFPRNPNRPLAPPAPTQVIQSTADALPSAKHQVLAQGWAFVVFNSTSLQADGGAGLTQGIIGLCNHGQLRKLDDWGTLRAWAWGGSRLIDYLETDKDIDARHIAVEGHSRYGKTALVAMAYDPRFTVAYISSSGAGGANLARRRSGEQLENIAGAGEYHWMGGNYLRYAELTPKEITPADMPVDTHELIALCAPRPVFIGGGTKAGGDGWADAEGTFLAEVAAGPVYQLLGRKGVTIDAFPEPDVSLITGDLAFRLQHGGHTPLPNYPAFLTFAARYMLVHPTN